MQALSSAYRSSNPHSLDSTRFDNASAFSDGMPVIIFRRVVRHRRERFDAGPNDRVLSEKGISDKWLRTNGCRSGVSFVLDKGR
jgi:hypothetical protein